MLGLGLSFATKGAKVLSYIKDSLKAYFRNYDTAPDFLLEGSVSFDGTNDYIDCGTGLGTALGDNYSGSLTVSLWFKADTYGDDGMFNLSSFSSSVGEFNIVASSSHGLRFGLNGDAWYRRYTFSDTSSWHHIACVYNTNGESSSLIYLDGSPVSTATSGSFPADADMDFNGLKTIIGAYHSTSYTFDGSIANVGIWNRALSASEIESIMYRSNYLELQDTELTNLVSWYDLQSSGISSTEFVTNGTMELDANWSSEGSPQVNERSTEQVYAGTYSRKVTYASSGWAGITQATGVQFVAGATYRLDYWIYVASGSVTGHRILVNDGTANPIDNTEKWGTENQWANITIDFTPANSGNCSIYFRNNGTGATHYFDNVSIKLLHEVSDSAGSNNGAPVGPTVNSDSYSGGSPFKPRIKDIATPKMAVQLADGSTDFSGSSQYIEIADDNSLSFGDGNDDTPLSISLWIYMDDATNFKMLSKGTYHAGEYQLYTNDSDLLFFDLYDEAGGSTGYEGVKITNAVTSYEGQWIHLCATYSGVGGSGASAGMKIYINGVSQGLTLADGGSYDSMGNTSTALTVGKYSTSYANGKMANLAIYSSELTQPQVQKLMFTEKYSGLSADLKTNLVSWYDMGSSSNPHNDLHGSNNGTNNSTTVNTGYTHSPHGVVDPVHYGTVNSGTCLHFDGSNDLVDTKESFESTFQNSFSISLWVKPDDGQPSGNQMFFGVYATASNGNEDGIQAYLDYDPVGTIHFNYKSDGDSTGALTANTVFNDGANEWKHLVFIGQSSGLSIYVNGVSQTLDGTIDGSMSGITMGDFSMPYNLKIGCRTFSDSNSLFYDGKINNFKIFSTALTSAQIQELYTNPEQQLPTGVSSSNLKLDLPMQEGAGSYVYDGSSDKNTGEITGASWATGESGGYQKSLVRSNTPMIFDGSDDVINTGNTFQSTFRDSFTISGWFKPDDGHPSGNQMLFGAYTTDNSDGIQMYLDSSPAGALHANYKSNGNNATSAETDNAIFSNGATNWTHIVLIVQSSGISIYVNGSLQALDSTNNGSMSGVTMGDYTTDQNLRIGARVFSGSAGVFFDGLINDFAIWNVALDADAVTALYGSGTPLNVLSDSGNYDNSGDLQGYWRNDGNTTWSDRSTNSNNGTASGSPVTIVIPEGSTEGRDNQGYYLSDTTLISNGVRFYDNEFIDLLNISADNALTVEAWIYPTSFGDVVWGDTGNDNWVRVNSATEVAVKIGGNSTVTWNHGLTFTLNEWQHFAMVRASTGVMTIYRNGGAGGTPSSAQTGTATFKALGQKNSGDYWNGKLDEFRFYDRALSATELLKNYNNGKASHS